MGLLDIDRGDRGINLERLADRLAALGGAQSIAGETAEGPPMMKLVLKIDPSYPPHDGMVAMFIWELF